MTPRAHVHLLFRTCDSRKYTYFFPSYMLIPPKHSSALYKTSIGQHGVSFSLLDFWKDTSADSTPEDDLVRKRQWRAPKEAVEALRETAKRYEGSHKFHNFTVGHEFNEMQSLRYMKKIEVGCSISEVPQAYRAIRFRTLLFTERRSGLV